MSINSKKSLIGKIKNSLSSSRASDNISDVTGSGNHNNGRKVSLQSRICPLLQEVEKDKTDEIKIKKWEELKPYEIQAIKRALSYGVRERNESRLKDSQKFYAEKTEQGLCGNCGLRKRKGLTNRISDQNS